MSRTTLPPLEDDFTRALLRSAEGDEPSSAAYAKAAAALGVGATLGVGASIAAPSALAGAVGLARLTGSSALRLWGLGVSGALLVGGGALLVAQGPSDAARATVEVKVARAGAGLASPAVTVAPSAASAVPHEPAPPAETALDADELVAEESAAARVLAEPAAGTVAALGSVAGLGGSAPSGVGKVSGSAVHRLSRPASNAKGSSLAEQVQSLDRARVALGSGDAGTALKEIARYRKSWPQGVFLTEASVLEIEALASRGERSLAAARAAAFVSAHPDSPQAERLRRLIPAQNP